MTEWQAFLAQSRSDYGIFRLLQAADRDAVPECHPLHYLQMASEKLAKALYAKLGVTIPRHSHVAFSTLFYRLRGMGLAEALGFPQRDRFERLLTTLAPLAREIDELCPAIGPQRAGGGPSEGPNVEYPWRPRAMAGPADWIPPCDHPFYLFHQLTIGRGRQVLTFIETLQERLPSIEA